MHCADQVLTFQTERFMNTIRRLITILVTMLCINAPFAQASTKPTPLQECTIFLTDGMYEHLASVAAVANWDVLTIQPAAGFYDGLALGGGMALMNSMGGDSPLRLTISQVER